MTKSKIYRLSSLDELPSIGIPAVPRGRQPLADISDMLEVLEEIERTHAPDRWVVKEFTVKECISAWKQFKALGYHCGKRKTGKKDHQALWVEAKDSIGRDAATKAYAEDRSQSLDLSAGSDEVSLFQVDSDEINWANG